jgi:glutamyl-tRNA synthetase
MINGKASPHVSEPVITRFPPSPTGYLHLGGARTALFNWLYARHTEGKFVLRIEDTDTRRSSRESVAAIFDALDWMGIDWDDGPYYQSERRPVYNDYIKRLLDGGHAYYCSCSPQDLEVMRRDAMAAGGKPKYDGRCRKNNLTQSDGAVVRIKSPLTGTTVVRDRVKGSIVFENRELDDFIVARSDGSPTYNFCVVVDDITMAVNTVIRGDDHVMNTPKQMLIYQALGHPLPVYAHVPMVLGTDRTRLSKRHGATSVTAYRDMGILPEAMINYLVRLGWAHGDQEFFTRDELIEKFSLDNIGTSAGVFDPEKLLALNGEHLRRTAAADIARRIGPFLRRRDVATEDAPMLQAVVETLQPRAKTLDDMAEQALFYFADAITYDAAAAGKFLTPERRDTLVRLYEKLEALASFDESSLEAVFHAVMAETGLKLGKIAQPTRVALTGRTASPGIFEIIQIMGKDKVLSRMRSAIGYIEARADDNR